MRSHHELVHDLEVARMADGRHRNGPRSRRCWLGRQDEFSELWSPRAPLVAMACIKSLPMRQSERLLD